MPELKDLTGRRFGSWTVLYRMDDHVTKSGYKFTRWMCKCDCGTERPVLANALNSGKTNSCGCLHREIAKQVCHDNFVTHGESKSRLYKIWSYMKKRCTNPNASNYADYGGRGITVCSQWLDDYGSFAKWANEHGYQDNLSIDRIDVNGDYSPDNCRWSTMTEQANNKRSNTHIEHNGEVHTISEWSRITGVSTSRIHKGIKRGDSFESIITQ